MADLSHGLLPWHASPLTCCRSTFKKTPSKAYVKLPGPAFTAGLNLGPQSRCSQGPGSRVASPVPSLGRPAATGSSSAGAVTVADPESSSDNYFNGVRLWEFTPDALSPLDHPRVADEEDVFARFLSFLISLPPVFGLMKAGSRHLLISTAEKAGIQWRRRVAEMEAQRSWMEEAKDRIENPDINYPAYYVQQFHAYDAGNLCWQAAFEAEPATESVALRSTSRPSSSSSTSLTVKEAVSIIRGGWLRAILQHISRGPARPVADILDMGCSVGISTTILADAFASAHVTGLDLSAYFLAVASFRQKEQEEAGQRRERPITWKHGLAENTGLPDESFDLITLASVVHECPLDATRAIFREAHRLLRPGGTFACFDNAVGTPDPASHVNVSVRIFKTYLHDHHALLHWWSRIYFLSPVWSQIVLML
eukprot:TRINITY_DN1454_c0_g1_i1.p1 TRINITY_DN1454_c0_g1~~TRINITY_DN1454_c0_g1_i1.p1  ORF type:complete len:480 (-),score=40.90 TRINITY_DN1454_c0_g1_i1:111-1382(-)